MKQNMTPKEKAKHLALKFTSSSDVVKPNIASIRMALLCVDVIDLYIQQCTPKDDPYANLMALEYWQEVKAEISLL